MHGCQDHRVHYLCIRIVAHVSPNCILTSSLLNMFFSSDGHGANAISQATRISTRGSLMLPVFSYPARLSDRLLDLTEPCL